MPATLRVLAHVRARKSCALHGRKKGMDLRHGPSRYGPRSRSFSRLLLSGCRCIGGSAASLGALNLRQSIAYASSSLAGSACALAIRAAVTRVPRLASTGHGYKLAAAQCSAATSACMLAETLSTPPPPSDLQNAAFGAIRGGTATSPWPATTLPLSAPQNSAWRHAPAASCRAGEYDHARTLKIKCSPGLPILSHLLLREQPHRACAFQAGRELLPRALRTPRAPPDARPLRQWDCLQQPYRPTVQPAHMLRLLLLQ